MRWFFLIAAMACAPVDNSESGSPCAESTWHADLDGDGFGDDATSTLACEPPEGTVERAGDCDDADPEAYPGAPEVCDGKQNDCAVPWDADRLVSFTPLDGAPRDVSAEFTSGSDGAPYEVIWEESGAFDFCGGTYFLFLTSRAPVLVVRGRGSADTTLSAGGKRGFFIQKVDAVVAIEGVTLTGANSCYGAALGVRKVNSCSESGSSAGVEHRGVDVTLTDVQVTGNRNVLGNSVISLYEGSLSLVRSAVHGNRGNAVWVQDSDFTCAGAGDASGVWGNDLEGVEIQIKQHDVPREVVVEGCDFGEGERDNTYTDFIVDQWGPGGGVDVRAEYGNDVSFRCDTTIASCE